MLKKFDRVYQFKITLKGTEPPIWRRIQIPETYTFWDLHVAIQDAMGWEDYHLHEFEFTDPSTRIKTRIGIPDEESDSEILPDWKQKIAKWFSLETRQAKYTYDFGDGWKHLVELEKILARDQNTNYPICIDGEKACPPEDCGGVWGYYELLKAIKDPKHERHEELLEWVGGEFDPEHFDVEEIEFDDPAKRRKMAFG